ncbi:NAD-dependent epimerase/dehydratase family protein [Streptococcus sp. 20-1249]|uniref:NAD-dependent epimerase/dehydratase family protein n=1 Tax=Streptococcus hepaticus TaxID=3349163 RepID=UPI00374906EE
MKILVTGANGYLGKGITTSLLDHGHEVIATDFVVDSVDVRAKRVKVNLFEVEEPYTFFEEPDAILHLAWRDGFIHNSERHILDFPEHFRFLKKLIEAGVSQVTVLGSMHEIGFFEGSINEDTPTNPQSLYGISKNSLRMAIELLCQDKVVFQWLRGFYIVGNSTTGSSIFSKLVQAADNGDKVFPFTSGMNQYDFLDYKDFCYYISETVSQKEVSGIINICSGRPEKLSERVERFIIENGLDIRLQYGVYPDRPYDSKALWGNNTKIQKILQSRK